MSNFDVEKYISPLIEEQFPDFYKEEGPDFIQFVKKYFEWMEQTGNVVDETKSLLTDRDIDDTDDAFLTYFKSKYMNKLPAKLVGNERYLEKHILDVYRSKGSIEGLKLLFILLYQEEIDVYIPSYDILKPSDGNWIERKFVVVNYNPTNYLYQGKPVVGATSGASAIVERYEEKVQSGITSYVMYLSSIMGTFVSGELLQVSGLEISELAKIVGSPSSVVINSSNANFTVGDSISIDTVEGFGFTGLVSSTTTGAGFIEFTLENGGYGYSNAAVISITTGSNTTGSGADFEITSFSNTSVYSYNEDLLAPYLGIELGAADYSANGSDVSGFAGANSGNVIGDVLTISNVTIGTIASIRTTNPGADYNGYLNVTITDPYTAPANIPDGEGGYLGQDAVVSANASFGSGIVTSVRVTGTGFGYRENQIYEFYNTSNTALRGSLTINFGGLGFEEGYWENSDGFLDSDKYIQDSYYYQEYSYEIKSSRTLTNYEDILKKVYHPAGNEVFGRVVLKNNRSTNVYPLSQTLSQIALLVSYFAETSWDVDQETFQGSSLMEYAETSWDTDNGSTNALAIGLSSDQDDWA